jgi:hypothetical protein
MSTDKDIMDQVKQLAEEFMGREYPDEAPHFHIAWDSFKEVLQETRNDGLGLKGPIVRDMKRPASIKGEDTVMAPMVIRAFHILFTVIQKIELEDSKPLKQEMLQVLSQNKFPLDFSLEIVDFFMENRDAQ